MPAIPDQISDLIDGQPVLDHVATVHGNPHGTTADDVNALSKDGGELTGPLKGTDAEFTGTIKGDGSRLTNLPDTNYTHTQVSASAVWNIVHNLGKYPSVTVIDSAGSKVEGDYDYVDVNTVQLTFSAAFAGTASLN